MKNTLIKFACAYGATGRENTVREVIRDTVAPYVDETRVDALGNLVCVKHGAGKRLMLAAHMDQIGFVVTDIDEKGFLRVHNVGGINKTNSTNRRVTFSSGLSGVLSVERKDVDPADKSLKAMFIDIGASSRAEAESLVRRGDVAVYAPDVFTMGQCVSGPAMDNRAGCAVLAKTLSMLEKTAYDLYSVFTAQEEVGLRGAKAAAYDIAPDYGIAIDVTVAGDTPKSAGEAIEMGAGIAVKIMDSSVICTPEVVDMMEQAAKDAGVKWQREVLPYGGTDAGAIQLTRGGVPSGVLSVPCRYVHSAAETVSVRDMEGGALLLKALIEKGAL